MEKIMIIRASGNEANVQRMLQEAMTSLKFSIAVTYFNGEKISGQICSYKYNHPITGLPPITQLSLYDEQKHEITLDINQIQFIDF